jgi:hypothetical protein
MVSGLHEGGGRRVGVHDLVVDQYERPFDAPAGVQEVLEQRLVRGCCFVDQALLANYCRHGNLLANHSELSSVT